MIGATVLVAGLLGLLIGLPLGFQQGGSGFLIVFFWLLVAGLPFGLLLKQLRKIRLQRWAQDPWFAVVGNEGLYYAGKYLPYSDLGSGLSGCEWVRKEKMSYLVFTFYTRTKNGRQNQQHRIPVPYGCEKQARQMAASLV
jgi:hypothetical protein